MIPLVRAAGPDRGLPGGGGVAHNSFSGGDSGGVTPVPVPNTVVKASSADGTAPGREWESRTLPEVLSEAPAG